MLAGRSARIAKPERPVGHRAPEREAATSKPVAAGTDCATAFQAIARDCLARMAAQRSGIVAGEVEAVHQMRIAIARLRAAVAFFANATFDAAWPQLKQELAWLHALLGDVRDADVTAALAHRRRYREWAARAGVQDAGERETLHRRVAAGLCSARFRRLMAALIGFTGILIVARPFGADGLSYGLLVALGCAFSFAGAAILTKRLTRIVSVFCILFWLTLSQTLMALISAGWDGDIALPSAHVAPWVLVMGVSGIVAHLGLTKALSLAPATIVTPIDFLRLPLIAIIGMMFYAEPFDRWVIVGGAVIFCANWLNLRAESRGKRATDHTV